MRREICLEEEATFTNLHKGAFQGSSSPITLFLDHEEIEFASGPWHMPCLLSVKYSHPSLPFFRSLLKWHRREVLSVPSLAYKIAPFLSVFPSYPTLFFFIAFITTWHGICLFVCLWLPSLEFRLYESSNFVFCLPVYRLNT